MKKYYRGDAEKSPKKPNILCDIYAANLRRSTFSIVYLNFGGSTTKSSC